MKIMLCILLIFYGFPLLGANAHQQLIKAGKSGNVDEVHRALQRGALPEQRDRKQNTALYYACQRSHSETMRILLAAHQTVTLAEVKRALITGHKEIAQQVVHAYVALTNRSIPKAFFLHYAQPSRNLNLLTLGLQEEVLLPGDITPSVVKEFLVKKVSHRSIQRHITAICHQAAKRAPKCKAESEEIPFEGPETLQETEGLQCAICIEPLSFRRQKKALPCYDVFHTQCIDRWTKEQKTCPECRRSTKVALHNEIGLKIPKDLMASL